MSKTKKGFTLVELLAVIVILAVILVIAVPSITSTITESRKGALSSSAKLIASSAESMQLSNQALGIEKDITCEDVSNYNQEDYECSIKVLGSKPYVSLIGKGKFEGMSSCYGTKENASVIEGSTCPPLAVEKIENLFTTAASANGLFKDDTADHNIRYAGASPKNYVEFGNTNELWRIIGIFNVKTASGSTEKLMKIVKDTQFSTKMSWDSSASSVNGGYGVNEWSQADLKTMLNTYYIGTSTTCNYCSGPDETCSKDCSSSVTPIGSTYREMIENVVWNTGAITYAKPIKRSSAYAQERGTTTGKKCSSGTYCNDSVTRETEWTGKVGLIYPSDYGYASTSGTDIIDSAIGTTNWLYSGSYYWTLSPRAVSDYAYYAWRVGFGDVSYFYAFSGRGVRPAIYLKSDVSITSGDGSSSLPYQLSGN